MDRFLDDNRIKAILLEENSSEEEIGSDEDDNEERVFNESDHDTESEFEIGQMDMDITDIVYRQPHCITTYHHHRQLVTSSH